jgi:F-type H+-transporting ATPase subunit gamma
MPSVRELRRRIRSVKNIRQITMALEAMSASRVRKATALALSARAYADLAVRVMGHISAASQSGPMHPLLARRDNVGGICIVLVTSDRGLCGAYNTNVLRVARRFSQEMGKPVRWIAVGRKGRDLLVRLKENVVAEFIGLPPWSSISQARPITQVIQEEFLNGYSDEVYVAYTEFVNSLIQQPLVQPVMPIIPDQSALPQNADYLKLRKEEGGEAVGDYIFEPSAQAILDDIVPKFAESIIFQLLLESAASEHSARMVAMRNASENAKALGESLQLTYNKMRQAAITSEILDIVGGVEAMAKKPVAQKPVAEPA